MSGNETPNRSDCSESYNDYLKRAIDACEAGDLVLGMHLYLAAYEKSVVDPTIPDGMALSGLREAWRLACELKERSMAEYVFEKLEPYLTGEEIAACAAQLQSLALDRLEQYGFSREELEDMAEMISQDFMGGDGSVVKVESIAIPHMGMFGVPVQQADEGEVPIEVPVFEGGAEVGTAEEAAASASGASEELRECDESKAPSHETDESFGGQAAAYERDDAAYQSLDDVFDEDLQPRKPGKPFQVAMNSAPADGFNPYDEYEALSSVGKSYHSATNEGAGAHVFTRDEARAKAGLEAKKADEQAKQAASGSVHADGADGSDAEPKADSGLAGESHGRSGAASAGSGKQAGTSAKAGKQALAKKGAGEASQPAKGAPSPSAATPGSLTYRNLVGYDEAVSTMRDFGVGLQHDRGYLDFIEMLNQQHGVDQAPAMDTFLFRAPMLEDASRFVEATIGEIGLPVLRMSMEEGFQGAPVLCVTTYGNHRPRMNHAHNQFEAPAILVIDDLDMWVMPQAPDNAEGMNGFIMANISRGAREAVNLIRSAVEDPDVFVLVTASTAGDPDPFFYDLLEPMTIVDIGLPNEKERADMWAEIARDHPSMRSLDRADLVKFSEGLSRYDLYMAAREALDEAYKSGLVQRGYVPVSGQNIYEKLAACQPLESEAYKALEDEVVRRFKEDLEHLEDLVNGVD